MARCEVCFRRCQIEEGATGFCGARTCSDGIITASNYGRITSLALDPIEKKPLQRFYPGSLILSAGSYGCNLRCPFCQNYEISWSEKAWRYKKEAEIIEPAELVQIAKVYQSRGSIGIAFTYNEPLVGYEFVLDTARLVHDAGMKTVLVTNGTADIRILEKLGPYVDAMNIDLKGFTDRYYNEVLKGSRQMVMDFIARAVQLCHVELTTLIVPGENDSKEQIRQMCSWIASLKTGKEMRSGREIPLHISRFFPRFKMQDRPATDVRLVYELAETAREELTYVYTGNC